MTDRMRSLFQTLDDVVDALESIGVRFVVGGSVACIAHGRWRTTEDVDIAAELTSTHVAPLCERLKDSFAIYEPAVLEAVVRQSSFSLIHSERIDKVDVFVSSGTMFDKMQFERMVIAPLPKESDWMRPLPLTSAEDIVLHKLMWFDKSDRVSERQWRDILGVLTNQFGKLDVTYMQQWAAKLSVFGLLEEAMEQAEMNVNGIDDGQRVPQSRQRRDE